MQSTTLLNILLSVLVVAEVLLVAAFIKVGWVKRSSKSTVLKCLSSVVFITIAALSALKGGGFTTTAVLMLCGFVMSLFGDFVLDMELRPSIIFRGIACFFTAHVFYLLAFIRVGKQYGETTPFETLHYVLVAAILVFGAVSALVTKMQMGKLLVPVALYCVVIAFMTVKAATTVMLLIKADGGVNAQLLALMVGSILFIVSDIVLAMMYFAPNIVNTQKKMSYFRLVNLSTYFAGQTLMALSLVRLSLV